MTKKTGVKLIYFIFWLGQMVDTRANLFSYFLWVYHHIMNYHTISKFFEKILKIDGSLVKPQKRKKKRKRKRGGFLF